MHAIHARVYNNSFFDNLLYFTGVCNLDGKVYVIGGWNGQRGLTRCDVYDPKTQNWSDIKPLHSGK
jgi:hypothetical protein